MNRIQPQITANVSLNFVTWGRMAAKIALGVTSHVYPEEWRQNADAAMLRTQMRNEHPMSPSGDPMGLVPGRLDSEDHLRHLVVAPQHAVWFAQLPGTPTALSVLLFGELIFGQVVDTTGRPVPAAWRLDPGKPDEDGRTTFGRLIDGAVRRIATPLYE